MTQPTGIRNATSPISAPYSLSRLEEPGAVSLPGLRQPTAAIYSLMAIALAVFLHFGSVAATAQDPLISETALVHEANQPVPGLVHYQGVLTGFASKRVAVRFSIFAGEKEQSPLWQEVQGVETDGKGSFTVLLGAGSAIGLPHALFLSGEPRWLAVDPVLEDEDSSLAQSSGRRILLTSVPYAMKSADANTLAGQPAEEFVTQEQLSARLGSIAAATDSAVVGTQAASMVSGSGTANYLPLWKTGSALGSLALFQTGSGSSAKVGLGTTAPATPLDVNGTATFRGNFVLPSTSATSAQGKSSPYFSMFGSSYSSALAQPVSQNFSWQVAPTGNNTASPSANLELLFGAGGQALAPTGLSIAPTGLITFAAGQTFPGGGAGGGTITGVTAGTGLTGGGTSGNVTLNLDSSKVPLLNANSAFTGAESFAGPSSFTGWVQISAGTPATTPAYPLDIRGGSTSQPMARIQTAGTDTVLSLKNTGSGGGEWWLDSGANGAGVGPGNFAIWNAKAGGAGLVVTPTNHVGIGTETPGLSQLAVISGPGGGSAGYFENDDPKGAASLRAVGFGSATVKGGHWPAFISSGTGSMSLDWSGVWGDAADDPNWTTTGVLGTADNGSGGEFINDGQNYYALVGYNNGGGLGINGGGALLAATREGSCRMGSAGQLACTGELKALVETPDARTLETYSVQSTENWIEDFGSGTLESGRSRVKLDSDFARTISSEADYHVFLTPRGDSKGLYVTAATTTGFEVRESAGGTSSIGFDYRIVAKRRGHEEERLVDVTERLHAEDEANIPKGIPARAHKNSP